jgi:LCP family protein required for cell wall assembly
MILLVLGIAIFFLGRSALTSIRDFADRLAIRQAQQEQIPHYPTAATQIAVANATLLAAPTSTTVPLPTEEATETPFATDTGVPTLTATNTVAPTIAPTDTALPTSTTTASLSPTIVPSDTVTSSAVPSATFTATATDTPPPTATATASSTATPTFTPSLTNTATLTPSATRRSGLATNTPRSAGAVVAVAMTSVPVVIPTLLPTHTPIAPLPTLVPTSTTAAPTQAEPAVTLIAAAPTLGLETLAATSTLPRVASRDSCTDKPQPVEVPPPAPRVRSNGNDIMNILLLGSDDELDPTGRSFRTDSIMIVSVNRTTNTVAMLSIPRDLYVCIPVLGMERVNVAYEWGQAVGWDPGGGFGLMQETIMYNMGIPIHFYAKVNLTGFKQIVDTVGGIDMAVDCPLRDSFRWLGKLDDKGDPVYEPFSLEPGFYHMNGSFALWYARDRKSTSDFDRNRRQQQVLRAIWRAAREQGLLQKAPELWGQLTQIVETNLQLPDMLGLVPIALSLDPRQITNHTMVKGYQTKHFKTPRGEDVQLPDPAGFFETIRNFYTPPAVNRLETEAAKIEVFNGSGNENWDRLAAEILIYRGLPAAYKGSIELNAETTVYDYTGGALPASMALITKHLNIKPARIIGQPDPNRTADFKIVLGTDFNSCTAPGFQR